MLLTALKIKLAAMVAVAGLETDTIKNTEVKGVLEKLAADAKTVQEASQKGTASTVDINKSLQDTVAAVQKAAESGDADANYAIAKWMATGVLQGASADTVMQKYQVASAKGHVPAMAELGGLILQAFPQDLEKVKQGIKLIQDAEAGGSNDARRALAQLTLSGVPAAGLAQDFDAARKLLEKGSEAGDGAATLSLVQLFASGVTGGEKGDSTLLQKDIKKALELLKKAAEVQNFPQAMSLLAARYFNGDETLGVAKDAQKAIDMFTKAADKGNAAANTSLAQIYENGLGGTAKDMEKAIKHYTAAAQGGDATASFRLANMLEIGIDKTGKPVTATTENKDILVRQNPKSALDLYRISAQSGLAEAAYNVGAYYETGNMVDRDLPRAFSFFQRAALSGLPIAQHKVAGYYQNGIGVGRDIVAAIAWYQRAAENKYAPSQLVLGAMYELGQGVAQNGGQAAIQYGDAAAQGVPLAMIRLASLYERGVASTGGKPEMGRSWAWARRAVDATKKNLDANAGSAEAKAAVEAAEKNLADLEKKMSADQKAEGKTIYDKLPSLDAPAAGGAAATPAAPAAPAAPSTPPTGGSKSKKGSR